MALKVGDRVRCVDNCHNESLLSVGRIYEIESTCSSRNKCTLEGVAGEFLMSRFVPADDPQPILVPVDPACVPDGWEAVRVGHPRKGEHWVSSVGNVGCDEKHDSLFAVCVIVCKKYVASVSLPKGWWVFNHTSYGWGCSEGKPVKAQLGFGLSRDDNGNFYGFTPLSSLNFTPPEDGQPRQVT